MTSNKVTCGGCGLGIATDQPRYHVEYQSNGSSGNIRAPKQKTRSIAYYHPACYQKTSGP